MDQSTANIVVALITAVVGPVAVVLVTKGNVAAAIIVIMVAVVPIVFLLLASRRRVSDNGNGQTGVHVADGPEAPQQAGAEGYIIHTVKYKETLSKIAQHYKVPLNVLVEENADTIPDPDSIFPGDEVRIPRESLPRDA